MKQCTSSAWETLYEKPQKYLYSLNMSDITVEQLINLLEDSHKRRLSEHTITTTLVDLGEPAVLLLLEVLKVAEPSIRKKIVSILGQIGYVQAIPTLIEVLKNDESIGVRSAAAKALGQFGDARAIAPLTSLLNEKYGVGDAARQAIESIRNREIL